MTESEARTLARSLASNVRRARLSRGWSLSRLARESGLAKATISQIEAGVANPGLGTVDALAGSMDVDPLSLLSGTAIEPDDHQYDDAAIETAGDEASDSTRRRILDVVIVLYRKHGYDGTSMGSIASELGVSAASLYYHYRSKEEVLFAAVHRALDAIRANAEQASLRPDPVERLRALAAVHVDYQLRQIEQVGIAAYGVEHLKERLSPDRQRELTRLQRATFTFMRDAIADGVDAGTFAEVDPTAAAFAVFGMCEHVMLWFDRSGPLDRPTLSALYGDLATRMVLRH